MPSKCTPEGNVLGHAWEFIASKDRPQRGEAFIDARCMRCGMEKRDTVSAFAGIKLTATRYTGGLTYGERQTMEEKRLAMIRFEKRKGRAS